MALQWIGAGAAGVVCFLVVGGALAKDSQPLNDEDKALIEKLQTSSEPEDRMVALRTMGWKHEDRLVDAVTKAMDDPAVAVRLAAVRALGDIASDDAVFELETTASDAKQSTDIHNEALLQLVGVATQHRARSAFESLDHLRVSADEGLKKLASQSLSSTLAAASTDTLSVLSQSADEALQKLAKSELASRGTAGAGAAGDNHPAAQADQKPAKTAAENTGPAFSDSDMKLLNGWRTEQKTEISDKMRATGQQAARYPTNSRTGKSLKSQITFLDASRTRLEQMSAADVGVSIEKQAEAAENQARGAKLMSGMSNAAADAADAEPTVHHTIMHGNNVINEYDTDGSGPAMMGRCFSLLYAVSGQESAAKAQSLKTLLSSLSPSAMEVINKRRVELDAQERSAPKPVPQAQRPSNGSQSGASNNTEPEHHQVIPTRRGRN